VSIPTAAECLSEGWINKNAPPADFLRFGSRIADFGSAVVSAGDFSTPLPIVSMDGVANVGGGGERRDSAIAAAGGTTALWAAPEVLRCERFTPAADVWSLGVTLYEMVERKSPYSDTLAPVAIVQVSAGELRPEICEENLPRELVDAIQRCFAPLPRDRPSAADVFEALGGLLFRDLVKAQKRVSALLRRSSSRVAENAARRASMPARSDIGGAGIRRTVVVHLPADHQGGEGGRMAAPAAGSKLLVHSDASAIARQHWLTLEFFDSGVEAAFLMSTAPPKFRRLYSAFAAIASLSGCFLIDVIARKGSYRDSGASMICFGFVSTCFLLLYLIARLRLRVLTLTTKASCLIVASTTLLFAAYPLGAGLLMTDVGDSLNFIKLSYSLLNSEAISYLRAIRRHLGR
jgi:hypothetical protein